MLNWRPESADMYEDVQTRFQYEHTNLNKTPEQRLKRLWRASRDSSRTPVQWDDSANAGFTTGEPWFYVNQNYKEINVAQQEADPDSILNFYKKAIALRKELKVVRHGNYRELYRYNSKLYVYAREMEGEKILVICSFSDKPHIFPAPTGFDFDKAELILNNYNDVEHHLLKPYETRVYLWRS